MYEAFESDKNIYPECDYRNDLVRFLSNLYKRNKGERMFILPPLPYYIIRGVQR